MSQASQSSGMDTFERWNVTACQNCGMPFTVDEDCPNDRDGIHIEGGRVEVVPAPPEGAVSREDVERLLMETDRYFAGDHVNAGQVVGHMRGRLRALVAPSALDTDEGAVR